jgi:DnaJ-class molecular chaperone
MKSVKKETKLKPICKNCNGNGFLAEEVVCPVCKGSGRK